MAETMKLKPCPFCGYEPHVSTDGENYFIECGNLNCINVCVEDRRDKAIRRWNTREEESKAEPNAAAIDNVNHPSHYETNGVECIVAMEAAQGAGAVQDFCICNAFKYIWRHKHKNGAEDIRKAVWYLTKWLELEGGNKEVIHAPTIDAEPVKYGTWLPHKITASVKCSNCRCVFPDETPRCPNCGANMRGENYHESVHDSPSD